MSLGEALDAKLREMKESVDFVLKRLEGEDFLKLNGTESEIDIEDRLWEKRVSLLRLLKNNEWKLRLAQV